MLTLFLESFDVSAKAFVDFQKATSFRSILYMHDDILLVKNCEGFQKYPIKVLYVWRYIIITKPENREI